ncbi:MAG: potassium-transporting ATPase subunit KdpC [Methylotenera sp.]|nr:potassium-transporting ATPase subunit KdpC [Oligoflexia bacterium]
MISEFFPALRIFLALTLLTGGVYPLTVSGFAQSFFKEKAEGSLLHRNGKAVGSELIGQEFKEPELFHSRPSAIAYNPMPSGGSNFAPTSADLLKAVQERQAAGAVLDLLFTSASGLDPHISPEAALSQRPRIARESGLDESGLRTLISRHTEQRTFGFLGEPRVNVLKLNLDLLEASSGKR